MVDNIQQAITIVKNGGIAIFPTDTAFAIGCRVSDEKAVKRLFMLRKRAETKAVPVLIDTLSMGKKYAEISQKVIDQLIEPYWPGPLTIVLTVKKDSIPVLVLGGGKTIGLRIPNHPVARTLIRGVGEGIVGCSANFAGKQTPFEFSDLDHELIELVDVVLPGECPIKNVSTVVDCSKQQWDILREGNIKIANGGLSTNKKVVILLIDTSDNQAIAVGLEIAGKQIMKREKIAVRKSQEVLQFLDRLLQEQQLQLSDISAITINQGPGSFIGLRVGMTVANTLSALLGIPVNGAVGKVLEPKYS